MTEPPATGASRPLRLAVFDVAGTTVDEGGAVYRALETAVRDAGAEPTAAQIDAWTGARKRDAIRALLSDGRPEPATDSGTDHAYKRFRELLAEAYRANPPRPLSGVEATLRSLKEAGIRVALSTGFDREITDQILSTIGWEGSALLDAVVCGDDVALGRPAPYLIFHAMEKTGVTDVRAVLVAGDTVRDIQAGLNGGCRTVVGVVTGSGTRQALVQAGAHQVLDSVADITPLSWQ